jgi:hypothetical protein
MDRLPHADPTTVMNGNPCGPRGRVQQRVQDRPIGDRVGAIEHVFGLAIGGCDRTRVEVIASDHDRGLHFPRRHQLVERKAGAVALAVTQPADTRRQALELDPFPR